MKKIFVITLLLILNIFYMPLYAENEEVRPDITSIESLLKKYKGTQRVQLHVDLAILYAQNKDWKNYFKHIKAINKECPELMKSTINFSVSKKKDQPNVIISPHIVRKLSSLNLSYINTQEKAIAHLKLLKTYL